MGKIALLIAFYFTAFAAEIPQRVSVRVETDQNSFHAQQGFTLDEDKITFVRNSNFLCPITQSTRLGLFETTQKENPALYNALLLFKKSVDTSPPTEISAITPHEFHFYVGKTLVNSVPSLKDSITNVVVEQCSNLHWTEKDAVEVSLVQNDKESKIRITSMGKNKETRLVSLSDAGCKTANNFVICDINGYGRATLQVQPPR